MESTNIATEVDPTSVFCAPWAVEHGPVTAKPLSRKRIGVVIADLAQFQGTGLSTAMAGVAYVAPRVGDPSGASSWSPPV